MSTSSVIGSMQSALNCAGKCDCCDKLQRQIDAINARISSIRNIDENALKTSIKASLTPDINTAVAGGIALLGNKLQPQINNAVESTRQSLERLFRVEKTANDGLENALKIARERGADRAEIARISRLAIDANTTANTASAAAGTSVKTANNAFDAVGNAQKKAALLEKQSAEAFKRLNQVEDIATTAARESSLSKGLSNQAITKSGQAVAESASASTKVATVARDAFNLSTEVSGLRGAVNGFGSQVNALGRAIGKLESAVGNAVTAAAEAVGISKGALAATGRLAGQVLQIFNVIGTIFTILDGMATRIVLGERIDAVETGLIQLGNDVSRILGTLLGLRNRVGRNEALTAELKNIGIDAKGISEAANLKAGQAIESVRAAQGIANVALTKAGQAQTTADGAVRNAAIANGNATTAYNKANEAQGIGEQAKRIAGDALGKAGLGLTTALTAIALYQGIKSLRGLRGIPGIPGRQGERGLQGIQGVPGTPGRDGVTTVVTLPGTPGARGQTGRQGVPGIAGRNGRDVSPAEAAGLRALIIQQHTQTRLNSTSQHSTTRTTILTPILAAFAPVLPLLKQIYDIVSKASSAAQLALLNIINSKLGAQVTGGISGLVTSVAQNTYVEKALAVLTFATTVHNALMLSSNLGQTLFMIIDQVTAFILPKGLDGTPINISNVLGKAVHEVIVSTVGEATAAEIQQKWDRANRIYQAALNIHNQVLGLGGVLTAGLEVIGGNVGKIGNALRKGGVLLENAYSYMNPQPNLKGKFFQQMNLVGENLQAIALVTAIPIALAAAKDGVDSSVADLKREISQTDPTDAQGHPLHNADGTVIHYKPGLDVPDPAVVKAEGDQAKADSTNFLQLVLDDIFDGGD